MFYKTLHGYIFRELLRIFLLTASALTTLLAFGGTFKPLSRQGLDIGHLLMIILNLMPAMLAYAIPIAALFAAVLVYWRLSTDNEMTACRASGISFVTIVAPAFLLGLAVASVDLVFVNYVVPVFLQRTEKSIISDLGSYITNQINQQQQFPFDKLVVYADSAVQEPTTQPDTSVVILNGMAGMKLKDRKPEAIVVARQARATIKNLPDSAGGGAEISFTLTDAAAFNPATLQKISGSVPALTQGGKPFVVPSQLKSKPKFLNIRELFAYEKNPTLFQPIRDIIDKMETEYDFEHVASRLYGVWQIAGGAPLTIRATSPQGNGTDSIRIIAPNAELDVNRQLHFKGTPGRPVRVEDLHGGRPQTIYTCDTVDVQLAEDDFGGGITGSLLLHDNVTRHDLVHKIGPDPSGNVTISQLVLPPEIQNVQEIPALDLLHKAEKSDVKSMRQLSGEAVRYGNRLYRSIDSELHSRGSFSLSCLTLVLFGAALGLLLRGKNPLAVFVVGFVPAVLLVLLITAGREMAEGSSKGATAGIALIWAGNLVLLVLVAIVYGKLLRQ